MLCILIWKDFYDTLSSGKSNGRKLQIHLRRGKCKSILIWKCMKYLWRTSNKLVTMTTQSKQIEGMGIEKMKNRQKRQPFHCTSFFNFLIFNPVKWLTTWKKKILSHTSLSWYKIKIQFFSTSWEIMKILKAIPPNLISPEIIFNILMYIRAILSHILNLHTYMPTWEPTCQSLNPHNKSINL